MLKTSKIISLASVAVGLAVFGVFANISYAAPLNYNADATVSLTSPVVNFTIASGSAADSLTVNATSVAVTISNTTGGNFTLTSASRDLTIATSSSGGTVTTSCTSGVASTTISQTSGSTVYTISPAASQCTSAAAATTAVSVSVGGGRGASSFVSISVILPLSGAVISGSVSLSAFVSDRSQVAGVQFRIDGNNLGSEVRSSPYLALFDSTKFANGGHVISAAARNAFGDTAVSAPVTVSILNGALGAAPPPVTGGEVTPPSSTPLFTKHLGLGSEGSDVEALQRLLVSGGVYPQAIISGYYGALTEKAVRSFQENYGIASPGTPGYGTVGPKTRAKLNAIGAASTAPAAGPLPPRLTGSFWFGKTGESVKTLQRMLAKDPSLYPEGIINGHYGPLTVKAVKRFQEKYGIVSGGDALTTGYGLVGPETRAKLNELYAK